jgi:hypothetical protein
VTTYPEINLVFLCDEKLSQKRIFETWMHYINPTDDFDVAYRSEYISDVTIQQLSDLDNTPKFTTKLYEAYPIGIASMQNSWRDEDVHRVQVTFTYRYYEVFDGDGTKQQESTSVLST